MRPFHPSRDILSEQRVRSGESGRKLRDRGPVRAHWFAVVVHDRHVVDVRPRFELLHVAHSSDREHRNVRDTEQALRRFGPRARNQARDNDPNPLCVLRGADIYELEHARVRSTCDERDRSPCAARPTRIRSRALRGDCWRAGVLMTHPRERSGFPRPSESVFDVVRPTPMASRPRRKPSAFAFQAGSIP
jgi:hypothetical protein